ncbi:hypothetical protein AAG570_011015 [Ranatra chinensis]|uniref:Ubiquitin-like protease family profile domain-containing protein n=1 Tax=Ranatra chinensis TaxID=642074 RepID=A0ABD0Z1M0_9HEMI
MVYPPPPTKGGISINTEDYACLGEDQFLNDVIIDFYLKYLLQTMLSEEDQKRTHVFSSFFYKRLTTRTTPQVGLGAKNIEDPKLSPAEKRHARVKGWTKSVDLFAKDFIIIPINENSHWFLGIICFPGLLGPVRMSDNTPVETVDKPNASGAAPATIGATTITMVQSTTITLEPDDEDRDEAEGDDEDLEPNSSEDEGPADSAEGELLDEATHKAVKPPKPPQEPIKQPCILIFDSLAGASRSRVCATLRDYLRVEYKLRHKKSDRTFSKDILKGAVPKVPQQTNFTDCGLYVLQYVESFFQKPITDYRMPIKMLRDWFTADIVSRKRYEIQQLLHKLMEEQNIDVMRLNLPFLGLKEDGQHSMEYDENEEEDEEGLEDEEEEDVDLGLEEEEQEEEEDLGLDRERALNIEERMQMEMEEEDEGDYDSEELNDNVSRTSELFCENSPLKRKQTVSLKEVHNQRAMNSSMSPPRDCKKMRCDD